MELVLPGKVPAPAAAWAVAEDRGVSVAADWAREANAPAPSAGTEWSTSEACPAPA